jgi:hypothetical protein
MVTMTKSSTVMTTGGKGLGKAVGQKVLGFEKRNAPLEIQSRTN